MRGLPLRQGPGPIEVPAAVYDVDVNVLRTASSGRTETFKQQHLVSIGFASCSVHVQQLLRNLRVRLRSFLRQFIGHLERRQKSQDGKWRREALLHPLMLVP